MSIPKKPCVLPRKLNGDLDVTAIEVMAAEAKAFKNPEGIDGHLRVYGERPRRKLYFIPTTKGRRHPKYFETKRELHDDWDVDLTGSAPEKWSDYIQRALRCRLP